MPSVARLAGFGDNVIDRYVDSATMYPGGSALNFAVHARRRGASTAYVGSISDNSSGDFVMEAARAEGVDVSRVRRYDGAQSTTDVRINESGNREFLEWVPTPVGLPFDDSVLDFLAGYEIVHTGHTSGSEEIIPVLAQRVPVSFDFSYKDLSYAAGLLPHLTVATFSASRLDSDEAIAFGRSAQELGPDLVILTRGVEPAVILQGETVHLEPAQHEVTPVDTLGAGDAFLAAFLTALADGSTLEDSASSASRYAAEVCLIGGAFGYGAALTPPEGATHDR